MAWKNKDKELEYYKKYKIDNFGFCPATVQRYGREVLKKLKETRVWKCSICGTIENLTIHHIDHNGINKLKQKKYSEINNDIENLEILCRSCHGGYHSRLKYKNLLNKKVNNL